MENYHFLDVISFHISPNGVFFSEGVREGDIIPTLNKRNQLTAHVDGMKCQKYVRMSLAYLVAFDVFYLAKGKVLVNNVPIVWNDEGATNGIIDGIDGLLFPPKK